MWSCAYQVSVLSGVGLCRPMMVSYQRRVISSNERPVFHRIPSRIMEVISRRWYHKAGRSARLAGTVEVIAGPEAVDFNDDPA